MNFIISFAYLYSDLFTSFPTLAISNTIASDSNRVIAEGKIGVYVFPGKEKLLKDKAKIIEQFQKEEEKLAEKAKSETEKKQ